MALSTQTIEKEERSTSGCGFLCKGRQPAFSLPEVAI